MDFFAFYRKDELLIKFYKDATYYQVVFNDGVERWFSNWQGKEREAFLKVLDALQLNISDIIILSDK